MMTTDPHNLRRFVDAQASIFETALRELEEGRKTSHWMWFIFPQLRGLGLSTTAHHFGIAGRDEAAAYLAHPLLGARLHACASALLRHAGTPLRHILGSPDDLKLRSSVTLFAEVAEADSLFHQVLATFCEGEPCRQTLGMLHVP